MGRGRELASLTAGDDGRPGIAIIEGMPGVGKTAVVDSIEEDFEGRIYLAVTVDDDPGNDLGRERKPGHRFFFGVEEVEPLAGAADRANLPNPRTGDPS